MQRAEKSRGQRCWTRQCVRVPSNPDHSVLLRIPRFCIYRLLDSRASRGSSQPFWHSQCESMKTSTSPVARAAPSIRPRMTPSLLLLRISFTPSSFEMYSLRADFRGPVINRKVILALIQALTGKQQIVGDVKCLLVKCFVGIFFIYGQAGRVPNTLTAA